MIRDKIVFWGLCATLVFLPMAFGSVEEWAILVFEVVTFSLFAVHIVGRLKSGRKKRVNENSSSTKIPIWLVVLLILFLVTAVFQLIPLPSSVLKVLSPGTSDFYERLRAGGLDELGVNSWNTLSMSPNLSLYELIKYIFIFLF
ncbi:hypothetical protein ACFLT2_13320, partial [Acidobacteriota bacterium]